MFVSLKENSFINISYNIDPSNKSRRRVLSHIAEWLLMIYNLYNTKSLTNSPFYGFINCKVRNFVCFVAESSERNSTSKKLAKFIKQTMH